MKVNNTSVIRSEVMPVLNMFGIRTILGEYTMVFGGVVEGIALDIVHANRGPTFQSMFVRSYITE
jgi:hypothetical protein